MERAIAVALLLLTASLPTVQASHNDVGTRFVVGDPQPTPTDEPDIQEGDLPVYHDGGSADGIAFDGTRARTAPPDGAGLGVGDWIGFVDGTVEYHGAGLSRCAAVIPELCSTADDPLYRVRPDPASDCTVPSSLTAEDCSGEGHGFTVDAWPGVRVQRQALDPDGGPGSGTIYPGTYGFYAYLFGAGTGEHAAGEGPFEHLPEDLCEDYLVDVGVSHSRARQFPCRLITPTDLADHLGEESALGTSQAPAVCLYAPAFSPLSRGELSGPCPTGGTFDQFVHASESPAYLQNKPGWYTRTAYVDPTGSLEPIGSVPTADGDERDDVARIVHTYVNPVPLPARHWCAAPPIATDAADALSTEGLLADPPRTEYLVEGHDLDVFTAVLPGKPTSVDDVGDDVWAALDDVPGSTTGALDRLPGPDTGPLEREVENASHRAGPTQPPAPEPDPGTDDNSMAMRASIEGTPCTVEQGLADASDPVDVHNLVDARPVQRAASGVTALAQAHSSPRQAQWTFGPTDPVEVDAGNTPLKDPTALDDEAPLPGRSDEQDAGAWHPSSWSFQGRLVAFSDVDGDDAFDGCPRPGQAPEEGQSDVCSTRLAWDAYNPSACADAACGTTWGDAAKGAGYTDPLGLVGVLEVPGPVVVQHQHSLETWVLGEAQPAATNCIVLESLGLFDRHSPQGDRVRALHGLHEDAEAKALLGPLCEGTGGDRLLVRDAFATQQDGGRFNALFTWSSLEPDAGAHDRVPGDRLRLDALLTTERVTDDTAGHLQLGDEETTATLERTWPDGDRTYVWTDVDRFATQGRER